jgi:hypothetical protein
MQSTVPAAEPPLSLPSLKEATAEPPPSLSPVMDLATIRGLSLHPVPPQMIGVYFLFRGEELQYIGESVDVISRVLTHKQEGRIPFDCWVFLPMDSNKDRRRDIELIYIRHYTPPYNGKPGGGFYWQEAAA